MFTYLLKKDKEVSILLIHILIAILSFFSIYFFIVWFYIIVLANIPAILNKSTRSKTVLVFFGYIFGLEIIRRMIKASPFIPYQVGNYLMLIVFSYCIIKTTSSRQGLIGKIILILCIPGFYMIPFENYFVFFMNSFSGIICLGLAAVYFGGQTYNSEDLRDFIKITILPIIIIAIYISLKTPTLNDVDFNLAANFETSGGFGSNQISTVLGLGACLLILAYISRQAVFSKYNKALSFVVISFFLFRGLLTFSRGGILTGLVAAVLSYLYLNWRLKKNISKSVVRLTFIALGCYIVFTISNQITGGTLAERYHGQTSSTLNGNRKINLNTITTNRSNIALAEFAIFSDHIFLGVGPGGGYEARKQYMGTEIASHTELTRLLAEQGIPGLLIGVTFLFYPLFRLKNSKSVKESFYLIAFFSLAIITSFHSSMRTTITPLFWSLSCARFSFPRSSKAIETGAKEARVNALVSH